jgi:hypothetical protein
VENDESGPDDGGYYLRAVGDVAEWQPYSTCGNGAASCIWIAVPTGGSYALENQWWYNEDDKYYAIAANLSDEQQINVEPCCTGGEDARTWYEPCTALLQPSVVR